MGPVPLSGLKLPQTQARLPACTPSSGGSRGLLGLRQSPAPARRTEPPRLPVPAPGARRGSLRGRRGPRGGGPRARGVGSARPGVPSPGSPRALARPEVPGWAPRSPPGLLPRVPSAESVPAAVRPGAPPDPDRRSRPQPGARAAAPARGAAQLRAGPTGSGQEGGALALPGRPRTSPARLPGGPGPSVRASGARRPGRGPGRRSGSPRPGALPAVAANQRAARAAAAQVTGRAGGGGARR